MNGTDCCADAAVRNAIGRLALLADEGELSDYLDQFCPDAVWRMPANPSVSLPAQERRGRTEIADGVTQRRTSGLQGPGSATRHVVSSSVIDLTDGRASARSYFRFYRNTDRRPELVSMGTYRDEFHLVDGRWLLAERTIGIG